MIKRYLVICCVLVFSFLSGSSLYAQCSVCTKTAEQLGEKPAKGLNAGILYLMLIPLVSAGYIGYRWWKKEKHFNNGEQ